jgi:hypothetical protein
VKKNKYLRLEGLQKKGKIFLFQAGRLQNKSGEKLISRLGGQNKLKKYNISGWTDYKIKV